MGLGKILGSISPAFGLISGKGLFGEMRPMLKQLGGMGLGGILGMLLSDGDGGGGGGGGEAPAGPEQAAQAIGNMGDSGAPAGPASPAGGGTIPRFSQYGMHNGQMFMGGRNPFGQNILGKFLGGLF